MRTFHALLVSCLLVWGLGMARAQAPNGGLVLIIIDDLLYPEIQAPVDRLQADLQNEGYSARISQFTVAGKTPQDLWNTLVSEYNTEGQTLLGAILIGNLPKAKNTSTNQTTDAVYWNLQTFGPVGIRNIWVSRMSGTVLELERALQANHDYRTGVSHLPQTAHFKMLAYPESESYYYPNEGANALEVWPEVLETHPAVAATIGGELIDETAHSSSHGLVTNDRIGRPVQVRFTLLTSCGQAESARKQVFSRGGGCVFSVGASATTYTGAFVILDNSSADRNFRQHLAAGYSWGESLVYSMPFQDIQRAMYWGDLSIPAMASSPNQVPQVTNFAASLTSGTAPLTVNFTVTASDPDGTLTAIEWFLEGYLAGAYAPTRTGLATTASHTYTLAHRYLAEADVVDNHLARAWSQNVKIVVAPSPNEPLRINCGKLLAAPYTYYLTDPSADVADADGDVWLHDQPFANDGTWGYEGGSGGGTTAVNETPDAGLWGTYQKAGLDAPLTYRIPIANGQYMLRLGFVEPTPTVEAAQRLVDVDVEQEPFLVHYDILSAAGAPRIPVDEARLVRVSDGELTIRISRAPASELEAAISLIELQPYDGAGQVPQAHISASSTEGHPPLAVSFDGSGSTDDGNITSYTWEFGDGATGSGSQVNHTFAVPGKYRAVLTVTDNTGLTSSAAVNILVKGLMAHWMLDEVSGVVAADATGHGHDGDVLGSTAWTTGAIGGALACQANDARVNLKASIDIQEQWTAAGWFAAPLPDTAATHSMIRGYNTDVQIMVNSSLILGTYVGGFRPCNFDMSTLQAGWHHLAAIGRDTTTDFYIDGEWVGTSDRKSESDIYSIGNTRGGNQRFADKIDDVRYYNYALTVGELAALAQAGTDAVCGNGLVEAGETCDPPDACPANCDDADACTQDGMTGSAQQCDVECSHQRITVCADGDGCCPSGCNNGNDDDCDIACGNGVIEGDETCDPPLSCPASCDDFDACTIDQMTGAPQNCDVVCDRVTITDCTDGDGCCPAGCNNSNDDDCFPECGNGVLEAGETCDPAGNCPIDCDDGNRCTIDTMNGSAADCNALCSYEQITACQDNDDCCPAECDSASDNDCSASCGNGTVEEGETCDPPESCPKDCDDGDACTVDQMTGNSQNCNVACSNTPVTACADGDGCCPAGCQRDNDSDCVPACGNGKLDPGETCDPPGSCPTSCDDDVSCTRDVMSGTAENCDAACSHEPVTGCQDGDGCCPQGCDSASDDDCSPLCGNGMLDPGETCDPPESCPMACDDGDECTDDFLAGSSSNCNVECGHTPIPGCPADDNPADEHPEDKTDAVADGPETVSIVGGCGTHPAGDGGEFPMFLALLGMFLAMRARTWL